MIATYERILASDIRVGDYVAREHADPFLRVLEVHHGHAGVVLKLAGGWTLAPRLNAEWWREIVQA